MLPFDFHLLITRLTGLIEVNHWRCPWRTTVCSLHQLASTGAPGSTNRLVPGITCRTSCPGCRRHCWIPHSTDNCLRRVLRHGFVSLPQELDFSQKPLLLEPLHVQPFLLCLDFLDEVLVVLVEGPVPEAGPVSRLVPGASHRAGRARKERRPRRLSPNRWLRQDDLGLLDGRHGRDNLTSSPQEKGRRRRGEDTGG